MNLRNILIITVLAISANVRASRDGVESERDLFEKLPGVDKCLSIIGLTLNDIYDDSVSTEKLCFAKCVAEYNGVIRDTGKLDVDKVDNIMAHFSVPDEEVKQFKGCLSNIDRIEICEDMTQMMDCAD